MKLSNHISKASVGKLYFVGLRQKECQFGTAFLKLVYYKQRQDGFMYQSTDVNIEVSPLCE